MPKDRNALKSGIFIVLTLIAVIAVIIGIKGLDTISEAKDLRSVSFTMQDDIGGLQPGDEVRIGGYKVGAVESIAVVGAMESEAKEPPRVRVEFTFPKKYVLHRDAMLRVQIQLTGSPCLNFENLGTGPMLPKREELTGHPGTMAATMAMLSQMGPPLKNILTAVDKTTLPAVNSTVDKFGKTADHASGLLVDARAQVDPAMKKYHLVADRAAVA